MAVLQSGKGPQEPLSQQNARPSLWQGHTEEKLQLRRNGKCLSFKSWIKLKMLIRGVCVCLFVWVCVCVPGEGACRESRFGVSSQRSLQEQPPPHRHLLPEQTRGIFSPQCVYRNEPAGSSVSTMVPVPVDLNWMVGLQKA